MAPNEKLKERISELINRSKGVDYEEIEWVMNQLGASSRTTKHSVMFRIPGCSKPLMLNPHNNGKKHLPQYCVADFCKRMAELGHYELDEDDEDR